MEKKFEQMDIGSLLNEKLHFEDERTVETTLSRVIRTLSSIIAVLEGALIKFTNLTSFSWNFSVREYRFCNINQTMSKQSLNARLIRPFIANNPPIHYRFIETIK